MYSLPIILPSEWESLKLPTRKGRNKATPFQKGFLEASSEDARHLSDDAVFFHRLPAKARKTSYSPSLGSTECIIESEYEEDVHEEDVHEEEEGIEQRIEDRPSKGKRGRGKKRGKKSRRDQIRMRKALKDTERGLYPELADRIRQGQSKSRRNQSTTYSDSFHSSPPRSSSVRTRPICSFFLRGQCKKGDDCPFRHEKRTKEPCKFFIAGTCRNGDDCPFSHDLSEVPCKYFHVHGFCGEGDRCRFSHSPISEEVRVNLIARTQREKALGGTTERRDGDGCDQHEEEALDDECMETGAQQDDGIDDGEEKEEQVEESRQKNANGSETVSFLGQLLSRFVRS
eukprot:TRINITY_DN512_c0_g1_i7.p1 TRINITY_DN512_c0_g1~~TRINITY_DN512_c0_g1_i7.p1  ORF type:complete len:342 (-),score=88.14 TRINITY_DN512_c0_g1_i7:77-1102(-)